MTLSDLKDMLRRSFARFYAEGMRYWSKSTLEKALRPRGASFDLNSSEVQRILQEIEAEGLVKLVRSDEVYLEVVAP